MSNQVPLLLMLVDQVLESGSEDDRRALASELQKRVKTKNLDPSPSPPLPFHPSDRDWLTAKEAATLLDVNASWLYRNWRRLPFAQKLLDGPLRFNREGLTAWDGREKTYGAGKDLPQDLPMQDGGVRKVR